MRQVGGVTFKAPLPSTLQPTSSSFSLTVVAEISNPILFETYSGSNEIAGKNCGAPVVAVPTYVALPSSINNCAARADAISASVGSTPRSNLREASEESLCLREFLAIEIASKRTASTAIRDVLSEISEFSPPIVPASARTCFASATTKSSGFSFLSTPSKVLSELDLPALRISRPPLI